MAQTQQPLAEVFGYQITDQSEAAARCRSARLCPFQGQDRKCTKDKANNPLGVCAIYHNNEPVITCPIRFRQNWLIAQDAALFFFGEGTRWSILTEIRLPDAFGKSAGNIDVVLVSYDDEGRITDFGAIEIQAVYISGNVRSFFEHYMRDPQGYIVGDWIGETPVPRPDYLSSSRKRLVPQLMYKGAILRAWNKKMAVVVDEQFFQTLPQLASIPPQDANMAWFIYRLMPGRQAHEGTERYYLEKVTEVFTDFEQVIRVMTTSSPGRAEDFIKFLQAKLHEQRQTRHSNL